jgi:hypothetical protein
VREALDIHHRCLDFPSYDFIERYRLKSGIRFGQTVKRLER